MAHEIMINDMMFTVGQRAWHGLGKVLDKAPTIADALKAAQLDWHVSTEPLFTAGGEKVAAQATRREDTREILGVVGPNYTAVQNTDALNVFQPLVDSGLVTLETAGSLQNGRKVWILARIKDATEERVGSADDSVIPYLLLANSHDGKTAVRLGFSPIRVVCANTLAAAQNSAQSKLMRITHTANVVQNLEALRDTIDVTRRDFAATLEQYRFLASRSINRTDLDTYVRKVFDLPTLAEQKRAPKALESAVRLFESEAKVAGDTYWAAYNAVQGFMQHEQGRSADGRLDSMWFGPNQANNAMALQVATTMAQAA